jgi:hypothetical protein
VADFSDIKKVLDRFGSVLVERAKRNLKITRKRKKAKGTYSGNATASGKLGNSIGFDSEVYKSGAAEIGFEMLEYGVVLNEGRKPTNGSPNPSKKFVSSIKDWIKDKRIKPKDKDGKFVKATETRMNGLAYVIARGIHRRGYDKAPFFGEALEQTKNKLNEIPDAYASVFDSMIESNFKANGFKTK